MGWRKRPKFILDVYNSKRYKMSGGPIHESSLISVGQLLISALPYFCGYHSVLSEKKNNPLFLVRNLTDLSYPKAASEAFNSLIKWLLSELWFFLHILNLTTAERWREMITLQMKETKQSSTSTTWRSCGPVHATLLRSQTGCLASSPVIRLVFVCVTRVCVCVPVKLRCKFCSYGLDDMLGVWEKQQSCNDKERVVQEHVEEKRSCLEVDQRASSLWWWVTHVETFHGSTWLLGSSLGTKHTHKHSSFFFLSECSEFWVWLIVKTIVWPPENVCACNKRTRDRGTETKVVASCQQDADNRLLRSNWAWSWL